MRALILAAGRGKRLGEITKTKPKCFTMVGGQSIIDRQINTLKMAGIRDIALVTGWKSSFFSNYSLKLFHNPRWEETEIVRSLEVAGQWFEDEPCIVSYSDIIYPPAIIEELALNLDDICIPYDMNWLESWTRRFGDPLLDAETFLIDPCGDLLEIGNKPDSVNQVMGQFMGLMKINKSGWASICRTIKTLTVKQADSIQLTQLLNLILQTNDKKITGLPFYGDWIEVDNEMDLAIANSKF